MIQFVLPAGIAKSQSHSLRIRHTFSQIQSEGGALAAIWRTLFTASVSNAVNSVAPPLLVGKRKEQLRKSYCSSKLAGPITASFVSMKYSLCLLPFWSRAYVSMEKKFMLFVFNAIFHSSVKIVKKSSWKPGMRAQLTRGEGLEFL